METNTNASREPGPQPTNTTSRKLWYAVALVVCGAALGSGAVALLTRGESRSPSSAEAPAQKPLYQCPMHPTITADHPSDCPICGMKLVEVKQAASAQSESSPAAERRVLFYRSPMDPAQTSNEPRKDEMGMDYLPVYEDEIQGGGSETVSGLATVNIDPTRQQLIGLRTAPATTGNVAGSWQTVGRVQVDPTRVRKMNVKVEGYVERMYVDFVGQSVRKGEPLFSLYSPSLLAAENEYLLALQTKESLASRGAPAENGEVLFAAARRKLELWDVPTAEIERLHRTRESSQSLTFLSPIAGAVTAKNVVEGARVNPGDTPYEITDLETVWVMADAYESDLPQVRVGMPAAFTVRAYAERPFTAEVAFIDPIMDSRTKTAKIHLHLRNPEGILKPEMIGEVTLEGESHVGLRIPVDAVIRSGELDVVFLALGNGKFEPRIIQTGARSGDQIEVIAGLTEGQEVVMRANFLVDSESQLRSSLAAIGGR